MVVDHLEEVLYKRKIGEQPKQRVFLLMGQFGSGKSQLIDIIGKLTTFYLGDDGLLKAASSNTAARAIDGRTVHSALGLSFKTSMQLEHLGSMSAAQKDR